MNNPILRTDSYKITHWKQDPPTVTGKYSYLESRGGTFPATVFLGAQPLLDEYLGSKECYVVKGDIDEAEELLTAHFGTKEVFNRAGWEHIVQAHGGRMPVEIRAVPEGTLVPYHNVLMTIESTCPKCAWVPNYLETLLMKVWYPTTVATLSYHIRKLITRFAEKSGDPALIPFKLHDFGYRGVSSEESAAIGGAAHLVNFQGTDTLAALQFIRQHYDTQMCAGFSIPAAEHSTICSWGSRDELGAFRNMLEQFPTGLVAVVSDTYDIFNACRNLWGEQLHDKVLSRDGCLVIRPDSGHPATVVLKVVRILAEAFGYTLNSKGYMALNPHVRVIQGDGINYGSIAEICETLIGAGYSVDNVNFGMGGALLQQVHRDTCQFAFKASAVSYNGVWTPISKRPATDPNKTSKAGCLVLRQLTDGSFKTVVRNHDDEVYNDLLVPIFRDGEILQRYTFEEVRQRAWPQEPVEE